MEHVATAVTKEHVATTVTKEHVATAVTKEHVATTVTKEHVATAVTKEHVATTVIKEHVATAVTKEHVATTVTKEHVATAVTKDKCSCCWCIPDTVLQCIFETAWWKIFMHLHLHHCDRASGSKQLLHTTSLQNTYNHPEKNTNYNSGIQYIPNMYDLIFDVAHAP